METKSLRSRREPVFVSGSYEYSLCVYDHSVAMARDHSRNLGRTGACSSLGEETQEILIVAL